MCRRAKKKYRAVIFERVTLEYWRLRMQCQYRCGGEWERMVKGLVTVMARVDGLHGRILNTRVRLYLTMIAQDCWHENAKKVGDAGIIDVVVRTSTYHFLNDMRGDRNESPDFLCTHYGLETREWG